MTVTTLSPLDPAVIERAVGDVEYYVQIHYTLRSRREPAKERAMNRRTHALTAAALATVLAAGACTPNTDTAAAATTGTQTATTQAATTTDPCTPQYVSADGTGITATHGAVTGTAALNCGDTPSSLTLSVELFYRPDTATPTRDAGTANYTQAATSYTVTATRPCAPGLYYLGLVYSGTLGGAAFHSTPPTIGPVATLTAADCANGGAR